MSSIAALALEVSETTFGMSFEIVVRVPVAVFSSCRADRSFRRSWHSMTWRRHNSTVAAVGPLHGIHTLFTTLLTLPAFSSNKSMRDDDELARGEDISGCLQEAIEKSRICLVVFSKSYASSKWCLNELVKILECKENLGQIVYPIFYDVDPSQVHHQTGEIGDALAKHESNSSPEQLGKWRASLTAVASLSGFHLPNLFNGHEAKFIEMIIPEVLVKLNHKYMDIARHPVGIDSCISELINKLSWTMSTDAIYVGIWGMGGVGKTTLAKAIFNQISPNFDGCSFLHVGSQVSRGDTSLVALQEKLLSDILRKKMEVSCVDHGIQLIKRRLQTKRLLIVLDEVVDAGQIYSLEGGRDCLVLAVELSLPPGTNTC